MRRTAPTAQTHCETPVIMTRGRLVELANDVTPEEEEEATPPCVMMRVKRDVALIFSRSRHCRESFPPATPSTHQPFSLP